MQAFFKWVIPLAIGALLSGATLANDIRVVPSASQRGVASPPEIYLAGEITESTVTQLADLIKSQDIEGAIVYLDSAGGDPQAGMDLGELIRKTSMNTAVGKVGKASGHPLPGQCMSACVLTLAGGKFRFVDPVSQLGIHRFYRRTAQSSDLDVAQVMSAAITAYFIKMGVSPSLFERMVQVGRGKMELLGHPEAAKLNLINNGVLPAEWEIEGSQGSVYLVGRQITFNGTGKVIMTCAPGRKVKFSALYDADKNNAFIAQRAVNYSLRINQHFYPIGQMQTKASISGGFVLASFVPDDSMIWSLGSAEQIGFAFQTGQADTFYGFLVDASGKQDLIRSWITHCSDR